ncbi:hypothetical protein [Mastigocladopsis repens]|uniref:hypothetical protein n=1 Tax=Mastigocladopsis repens TaxID=221287 RepID=UPI0003182ABE|nr:hypothetical protein [Mastigocladopsis repens]
MTAITLSYTDQDSTKPVTTTIYSRSTKAVTPQRLQLIAKVVKALSCLPQDEIKCLADQLEMTHDKPKSSHNNTDLAAKLGVDPISEDEQRELELAALKNYFEWRQELLKDSFSASEVAKLLGAKSRQTPHDRRKNNSLVAVEDNGVWKFPRWQFDPHGSDGVIDGLPDVLKALKVPALSQISWLNRRNPALNGLTPVQALKHGQKDDVIAQARAVGVI